MWLGVAFTFAACVLALLGSGRGYTYDESLTIGAFVSRGLATPFSEQVVHNNHPLFSFLEHLAWEAGATSEVSQRFLPAVFGALAVGVVTWWCTRRWGALAGACGGAVLLVHPLALDFTREVRGYSLLVLAATVSTLLLLELVESDRPGSWVSIAYVLALAVGFATHLYLAPVVLAHVGLLISRRKFTLRAVLLIGAGAVLGLLAYVQIPPSSGARRFLASFPLDAAWQLFAGSVLAVVVLFCCATWAVYAHRRDALMVVLPLAGIAAMWLIVQPYHFYPRFLVCFVPGVAGAAAWAVHRSSWMAGPVLVAILAMALQAGPPADGGIRRVAQVVDEARSKDLTVCAVGSEALVGYTAPPFEFHGQPECEVVVRVGSWDVPELDDLENEWGPGLQIGTGELLAPDAVLEELGGGGIR